MFFPMLCLDFLNFLLISPSAKRPDSSLSGRFQSVKELCAFLAIPAKLSISLTCASSATPQNENQKFHAGLCLNGPCQLARDIRQETLFQQTCGFRIKGLDGIKITLDHL